VVTSTVVERYLRSLRDAPVRIAAVTHGVDDATLHRRTEAEPWSVNDILAHLRAAADVRERFIDDMSTGEHATMRYESPRSELRRTDYPDRGFAENLAAFRAKRSAFAERLEALPLEAWARGSAIGTVRRPSRAMSDT
jgi:hypothetical protein